MVTTPEELEAGRALFADVVGQLKAEGVPAALPQLGIMVEVPAAALTIERFNAAFLSIGSNDLVQYVTACDRTNGALGNIVDPLHPAVLELVGRTVEHGRRAGIDGEPVRRHGRRSALHTRAAGVRLARAFGQSAVFGAGQGDHRRR